MNQNDVITLFRYILTITGMYQKDLAQLLGISDRYMKRLMSGRDQPSDRLLERIGIKTIKTYEIDFQSTKFKKFITAMGSDDEKIKNIAQQINNKKLPH